MTAPSAIRACASVVRDSLLPTIQCERQHISTSWVHAEDLLGQSLARVTFSTIHVTSFSTVAFCLR